VIDTMRAYLDNNVVSSIARDDTETESAAIDRLLAAKSDGKVDLVTSELTLREIERYRGAGRTSCERIFNLLEKVPVAAWDTLVGMHSYGDARTWMTSPLIQTDALYTGLIALGLDVVDAQHVFVASKHPCHVFLTCDRGVLARAAGIRQLCELSVQKPSDFVTGEGW
jgi:predicted nucleic acid-binding protein